MYLFNSCIPVFPKKIEAAYSIKYFFKNTYILKVHVLKSTDSRGTDSKKML